MSATAPEAVGRCHWLFAVVPGAVHTVRAAASQVAQVQAGPRYSVSCTHKKNVMELYWLREGCLPHARVVRCP